VNNRILLFFIGTFAIYAGAKYINHPKVAKQAKIEKINVVTQVVKITEVNDSINALGTVISNESVDISSTLTKRVTVVNFTDGQYVKKGDLLAQLETSQEEAEEKRLELNLAEQEREFKRLEPLRENGVVSAKDYETQHTKMLTAKAELEHIQAKIREAHIIAPFDGILGMRQISVGSLVSAGTLITTIDDIKTVKVDFFVPEKYVLKLQQNGNVFASSEASQDRKFEGKILAISTRVDENTHNASVRGIFPNSQLLLRPGMLLKINIPFDNRQGICIPETAICSNGNIQYVYKIIDNVAKIQHVKIGSRFSGKVEIIDGLSNGDEIVTDGVLKVKEGGKINRVKN